MEYVSARPGEAASGLLPSGARRGVIEGVLGAYGVQTRFLTPLFWKRRIGLPPGDVKNFARSEAIRRWPAHAPLFARKGEMAAERRR